MEFYRGVLDLNLAPVGMIDSNSKVAAITNPSCATPTITGFNCTETNLVHEA